MTYRPIPRRGLTLIELLVAIAIIAILIALLVAGIQQVRQAAAQAECANHLKQLALAAHSCQGTHARLPPAVGTFPGDDLQAGAGIGPAFFHLLPFLEQGSLYQSSHVKTDSPRLDYFDYERVGATSLPIFNC